MHPATLAGSSSLVTDNLDIAAELIS